MAKSKFKQGFSRHRAPKGGDAVDFEAFASRQAKRAACTPLGEIARSRRALRVLRECGDGGDQ